MRHSAGLAQVLETRFPDIHTRIVRVTVLAVHAT